MIDPSDRICAIVTRLFAPIDHRVRESSMLRRDLQMDSLDIIDFAMELEDAFNVTITDDLAMQFVTVGDAVLEVRRQKQWG